MRPPNQLRAVFAARTLGLATALLSASVAAAPLAPASPDPSAIIGGGPSNACAWPSTVFLENCTGTLIHPEIVVYAAHCGDDRERVWFGEDISSGTVEDGQGFSVETEYCMINPDYLLQQPIGPSRAADYAFCKLAEPVLDVPIVPPVMGCETTALLSGTPVTLVGFGASDQDTFGVKFEVETVLHYIDDWGVAVIGGDGFSPCAGDSGGPAFMQVPDGSWRSFGIVSGPNFGNCSDAMWFPTIYSAIPFIESNSGIDVSACHHSHGEWNPSPTCGDFPTEPWDGEGKSWADGCAGGPTATADDTCGPPFDPAEDLAGPVTTITAPEDRARFDTEDGERTVVVDVTAEAMDAISGVAHVSLVINGNPVDGSTLLGPPYLWPITLPPGVWEIESLATDWADNEATSMLVVVGVDEDPPPAPPPPSDDTGGDEGADTTTAAPEGSTGDAPDLTTGAAETSGTGEGDAGQADDGDGCSCRQSQSPPATGALLLLFGLAARRRRRVAAAISSVLAGGCADDSTASGTTETSDSTTTGAAATPSAPPVGSSGEPTINETSGTGTTGPASDSSSDGPRCEPGTEACVCLADFTCDAGLGCSLNTCIPCKAGTLNCPCSGQDPKADEACEADLNCFGGLCVNPQPCPWPRDGQCDEPQGAGGCLPGTDAFDCCPTQPGVCEEAAVGGRCPDGSDPDDCDSGSSSEDTAGSSSGGSTGTSG